MKNKHQILINGFIIGLLIISCNQPNTLKEAVNSTQNNQEKSNLEVFKTADDSINKNYAHLNQDSINKIYEAEKIRKNRLAIKAAEKDFFKSLKNADKDFHENNYIEMEKVFKKNNIKPYELYIELTEIFKKSKAESIKKAISSGMQERKCYDFIGKIKENYVSQFQNKYGISNRLYVCFTSNYCNCYGGNSNKYCFGKKPIFPNSEFWN